MATRVKLIATPALRRRQPTQTRADPWPFLLSSVEGRGLVKNVPIPVAIKPDKKK